ncbi:hypothetical protein AN958_09629 [Leucoagaricus sp. SymC.cos]|nr:hypothetical protein AN958_09629 [Leucoagaricus sp. SymC.cos]
MEPTFGCILGCASAPFIGEDGDPDASKSRLYQILISEAACKIWSITCMCVIEHRDDRRKWPTSSREKFRRKAADCSKVRATWLGMLHNELSLPLDWPSRSS